MTDYGTSIYGKDHYGTEIPSQGTLPRPIQLTGVASEQGIALHWLFDKDPFLDTRVTGLRLIRNFSHAPSTPFDGVLLATVLSESFFDGLAAIGSNYYSVYITAENNRFSIPALLTLVRPTQQKNTPSMISHRGLSSFSSRGSGISNQLAIAPLAKKQTILAHTIRTKGVFMGDSIKIPVGTVLQAPEGGSLESISTNKIVYKALSGRTYSISGIKVAVNLPSHVKQGQKIGRSGGGSILVKITQDDQPVSLFNLLAGI